MIVLSNSTEQTVPVGESIIFDTEVLRSGCSTSHRKNTGSVKMRCNGIYGVSFHGNLASPTAYNLLELSIQTSGETLPETTMYATPAVANTGFNNVSASTKVRNYGGEYDRISVVNTGTNPIIVAPGSSLVVAREYN